MGPSIGLDPTIYRTMNGRSYHADTSCSVLNLSRHRDNEHIQSKLVHFTRVLKVCMYIHMFVCVVVVLCCCLFVVVVVCFLWVVFLFVFFVVVFFWGGSLVCGGGGGGEVAVYGLALLSEGDEWVSSFDLKNT